MESPKGYREANVTYFVGPFTRDEQIYIDCHKIRAIRYGWRHNPSGKMGSHIIYVFPEDVKRSSALIAYWNRTKEWTYSPAVEQIQE